MRAAPITYDNGQAPFTPGVRPDAHRPEGELALPAPSHVAQRVIETVAATVKPILLHERSHADLMAEARRNIERGERTQEVLIWMSFVLAAVAFIVVMWMLVARFLRKPPPD